MAKPKLNALTLSEGELALNPYRCFCELRGAMSDAEADEDYASHKFDAGRQAQLAHDKGTMVKLPSDDELAEILRRATEQALSKNKAGIVDNFDSIAQELRRLLSEGVGEGK